MENNTIPYKTINKLILEIEKTNNIDEYINERTIKELEELIEYADETYYKGEQILDDIIYDKIKDIIEEKDVGNEWNDKIGTNKINNNEKIKLEYNMGSMNKIKLKYNEENNQYAESKKKLEQFKNKNEENEYIIADKLDGVSAMVIIRKDKTEMYTRGDGINGTDISHMIKYINNKIEQKIYEYLREMNIKRIILRGELIIKKETFNTKYIEMANARNMVAGLVNSKNINIEKMRDIDLVIYEIIEPFETIKEQYKIIRELELNECENIKINRNEMLIENLINKLEERKRNSEYMIDGIIITDANNKERNTTGNPKYSIALKKDTYVEAIIKKVEWKISKDGLIKPRINIETTQLDGVLINYATAKNAKYIYNNKIGEGTKIILTRSGDVVPNIAEVIENTGRGPQMPEDIKWEWNKSGVDIIITEEHIEILLMTIVNCMKHLEIKYINEETIRTLIKYGVIEKIEDIFKITKEKLKGLEGFQETKINKVINELTIGFNKMTLVDLMTASNIFGHGIGRQKIQKIMEVYPDIILQSYMNKRILINNIKQINGYDEITAEQFVNNLMNINELIYKLPTTLRRRMLIETIPKKNVDNGILLNKTIVFTHFRDTELTKQISQKGGKVITSVSRNVNIVIIMDGKMEESSSKIDKAKEYEIEMITKSEFIKKYIEQ